MKNRYQHAAGADGDTSGGSGAGAAAGAAVAGAQGAVAAGSALSAGAAANNDWLPEKFRVLGDDGKTINIEASARKLATEGYSPLEKRLGSGELPPTKPEEYKLAPPQGMEQAQFDEFAKDPDTQAFLKEAHAEGLTSKQLNFVVSKWLERAPQLLQGAQAQTVEGTTTELKKLWKTDDDYSKNLGLSYQAASTLAVKAGVTFADLEGAGLGNNPTFIRLMAALGPEIGEDILPNGGGAGGGADLDAQIKEIDTKLTTMKLHDPERPKLLEQKMALYDRKFPKKK